MSDYPDRRAFVERTEVGYRAEVYEVGRCRIGRRIDIVTGPLLDDVLLQLRKLWPDTSVLVLDEDGATARELFTGIPE